MNGEVPPQVDQVEQVLQVRQRFQGSHVPPQGDPIHEGGIEVSDMSNREIREALIAIARAVTMQANLTMIPRVVESTMTSRLRDFVRIPKSFLMECTKF